MLSHLQDLQQLTHLTLRGVLRKGWGTTDSAEPPATAYAALTASSKLQHLDISSSKLPAGVWQHVFPPSRQLPHLHILDLGWVVRQATVLPKLLQAAGLSAAVLRYSPWTCSICSTAQSCWLRCKG